MDGGVHGGSVHESRVVGCAGSAVPDRRPAGAQHRGHHARPSDVRAADDVRAAADAAGPAATALARGAAVAPVGVLALICIALRSDVFELAVELYMAVMAVAFLVYYVQAVRQYGRWLLDNYADLERKEVWQSLLLLAFILFVHVAYSTNGGALVTEYLSQVNTFVIIAFLVWRVDTLQELKEE